MPKPRRGPASWQHRANKPSTVFNGTRHIIIEAGRWQARTYIGDDHAYIPSAHVHVASTVLLHYTLWPRAYPGQGRVMTTHQQRWLLWPTTATSSIGKRLPHSTICKFITRFSILQPQCRLCVPTWLSMRTCSLSAMQHSEPSQRYKATQTTISPSLSHCHPPTIIGSV